MSRRGAAPVAWEVLRVAAILHPRGGVPGDGVRDGTGAFGQLLTTVYGTEDYLPATIESVLAQTSPDWEMVVVDNGLSSRVVEIVSRYAHDGRIRLIRQKNRGYRGGITAAAEAARGRYMSVLDSDDKIMPSFVSAMADVIAAEPGIDAVGCDAVQFDDTEQAHLPSGYLLARRAVAAALCQSTADTVGHPRWRYPLLHRHRPA